MLKPKTFDFILSGGKILPITTVSNELRLTGSWNKTEIGYEWQLEHMYVGDKCNLIDILPLSHFWEDGLISTEIYSAIAAHIHGLTQTENVDTNHN